MRQKTEWAPESLYQFSSYFDGDPRRQVEGFKKLFFGAAGNDLQIDPEKVSGLARKWYELIFGEHYFAFSHFYSHGFLLRSQFNWEATDLENLLSLYELAIKSRTETYSKAFLSIDPKKFKKNIPSINELFDSWTEFLWYLWGVCLSREPKIIEHFLKFQLKADKGLVFFDFEKIKKELISIQKAGIANIDFVNAIDEILAYHLTKVFGVVFVWIDTIKRSDRTLSRLKKEKQDFLRGRKHSAKDRFSRHKFTAIFGTLFRYDALGGHVSAWIEVLANPEKFDKKFFSQQFSKYIKPLNSKISDREFFSSFFELFKAITNNPDFLEERKPAGYDSTEQYQALTVKRLLYKRTK